MKSNLETCTKVLEKKLRAINRICQEMIEEADAGLEVERDCEIPGTISDRVVKLMPRLEEVLASLADLQSDVFHCLTSEASAKIIHVRGKASAMASAMNS